MISLFNLHGASLASLNTGPGLMRVAIGETVDLACTRPSLASIEGDGNAGGGSQRDTEPLLEAVRRPLRGFPNEADRKREIRAIETIRGELHAILDLTSGSLRIAVSKALTGLEIEDLWLHEMVYLELEARPHATRPEINALITEIHKRKGRPEFYDYAVALSRFNDAISSLKAHQKRLIEVQEPFPPQELKDLLDSFWHANEKARARQQEMHACRQIVSNAWASASWPKP